MGLSSGFPAVNNTRATVSLALYLQAVGVASVALGLLVTFQEKLVSRDDCELQQSISQCCVII